MPIRYGCRQCVLVGDPKQLPATIMSQEAVRKGYSRSLFARLTECGHPFVRLKYQVRTSVGFASISLSHTCVLFPHAQYRSHPDLSVFPSQHFYDGELLDSEEVKQHRGQAFHASPIFRPFLLYDVQGA